MHFTLSTAVNSGQASNTIYPHQRTALQYLVLI